MPLIITGMKENLYLFITQYSSDDGDPGPGTTNRLGPQMGIMALGPMADWALSWGSWPWDYWPTGPVVIHCGANLDISVC